MWTSPNRKKQKWEGTLAADNFEGDGSLLTGVTVAETDPKFNATSNALITNGTIQATSLAFNGALNDGSRFLFAGSNHASLAGVGTNTHTQIDAHIASGSIHNASSALMVIFQGASGALIASGSQIDMIVPFNCEIKRYTTMSDVTGTAIIEVWRNSSTYPPTGADRITGPGIMVNASKTQSTSFTSWSAVTLAVNDMLRFNVSGATTSINRISVILEVLKAN